MSNYQFNKGQQVIISCDHGHLIACNDTMYQVGSIDRVQGTISVQLLQDGKSMGAIPENKLKST